MISLRSPRQVLDELVQIGSGAEEYLCKYSNLWGSGARCSTPCHTPYTSLTGSSPLERALLETCD